MSETIASRLQALIMDRKLRVRALEKLAGVKVDAVRSILKQDTKSPRWETVVAVAAVLEVDPHWLLTGEGVRDVVAPEGAAIIPPQLEKESQALPMAADELSVPVLGSAAGSFIGAIEFEGAVIDYVDRPAVLRQTSDAYAIYVTGTSMEPEHKQGDLRFVHPRKPPRVGDSVIVQTSDGPSEPLETYIGHLKRVSAKEVILDKLNPPSELVLPRSGVRLIHRVLTMNELFGR